MTSCTVRYDEMYQPDRGEAVLIVGMSCRKLVQLGQLVDTGNGKVLTSSLPLVYVTSLYCASAGLDISVARDAATTTVTTTTTERSARRTTRKMKERAPPRRNRGSAFACRPRGTTLRCDCSRPYGYDYCVCVALAKNQRSYGFQLGAACALADKGSNKGSKNVRCLHCK